jgi:hypothetical protein
MQMFLMAVVFVIVVIAPAIVAAWSGSGIDEAE